MSTAADSMASLGILDNLKVRLAIGRARRSATAEQKTAIDKVLGDRDKFGDLVAALRSEYDSQAAANPGTPFTDFLDWLIKNLPAIIALIMSLINPTPVPTP